jgi:hypothetical protein
MCPEDGLEPNAVLVYLRKRGVVVHHVARDRSGDLVVFLAGQLGQIGTAEVCSIACRVSEIPFGPAGESCA